jgi:hypothetical protein
MFEGSHLKIQRAKSHIDQLKTLTESHIADNPYRMSIQSDPQGGLTVAVKGDKPIPNEIALVIGDAIHNLRTALDHATWELIGIDGGTQDRWTKLPASATGKVDYEAACRGLKTPRDDTKQFFIDLAVYEGSGSPLYALHVLDNTDKHMILLPMLAAARISTINFLNPDGSTAMTMTDCTFGHGPDGVARLASLGPGMSVETDNNTKITPAIFFAPNQPLAGEPVLPTLDALANQAAIAIDAFTSFVVNRSK